MTGHDAESPEAIADLVTASMAGAFASLSEQLASLDEDAFRAVEMELHARSKNLPGPSVAELEQARAAGEAGPDSPPEKWVAYSALTMLVAVKKWHRQPS